MKAFAGIPINCEAQALSLSEISICRDSSLNALYRDMREVFSSIQVNTNLIDSNVITKQTDWERRLLIECNNTACLSTNLQARTSQLRIVLVKVNAIRQLRGETPVESLSSYEHTNAFYQTSLSPQMSGNPYAKSKESSPDGKQVNSTLPNGRNGAVVQVPKTISPMLVQSAPTPQILSSVPFIKAEVISTDNNNFQDFTVKAESKLALKKQQTLEVREEVVEFKENLMEANKKDLQTVSQIKYHIEKNDPVLEMSIDDKVNSEVLQKGDLVQNLEMASYVPSFEISNFKENAASNTSEVPPALNKTPYFSKELKEKISGIWLWFLVVNASIFIYINAKTNFKIFTNFTDLKFCCVFGVALMISDLSSDRTTKLTDIIATGLFIAGLSLHTFKATSSPVVALFLLFAKYAFFYIASVFIFLFIGGMVLCALVIFGGRHSLIARIIALFVGREGVSAGVVLGKNLPRAIVQDPVNVSLKDYFAGVSSRSGNRKISINQI